MSREVVRRIGRVGVFLAALALCTGAGWGVGAGWGAGRGVVPAAAPEVPSGHHH